MMRAMLYEAAQSTLVRSTRWSWLGVGNADREAPRDEKGDRRPGAMAGGDSHDGRRRLSARPVRVKNWQAARIQSSAMNTRPAAVPGANRKPKSSFVLTSERGLPFTAGFARMFVRASKLVKLAFKAHPHKCLTPAGGFALANKGHDTRALQAYSGHRSAVQGFWRGMGRPVNRAWPVAKLGAEMKNFLDRRGLVDTLVDGWGTDGGRPMYRLRAYDVSCASGKPLHQCPHCSSYVIAATWSERASERCVRNVWSCEACGCEWETAAYFSVRPQSTVASNTSD